MKKETPVKSEKGSIIGYSEADFATLIRDKKLYIVGREWKVVEEIPV